MCGFGSESNVSLVKDSSENDEHQFKQLQQKLSMTYIRCWLLTDEQLFYFLIYFIWNLINIISVLKKYSYDSYGCIIFRYEKAKIFSNLTTNHLI